MICDHVVKIEKVEVMRGEDIIYIYIFPGVV